ncbi:359_t:CDS:2 [Paraglomus brasilianum]|uniref:359_t:CDS:1 n=1 Tax=Paraglomus brasilianum TaxID=144538 RepID=A0A9N9F8X9_9GLOM|nr:359_t:CDS:2 [Paraglomus brasilianum]
MSRLRSLLESASASINVAIDELNTREKAEEQEIRYILDGDSIKAVTSSSKSVHKATLRNESLNANNDNHVSMRNSPIIRIPNLSSTAEIERRPTGVVNSKLAQVAQKLDVPLSDLDIHDKKHWAISTLLDEDDAAYIAAKKRFLVGLPQATIRAIIRLQMPQYIVDNHIAYKERMASEWNMTPTQITQKMYHGTKKVCNPFDLINGGRRCENAACGLCGIMRAGNKGNLGKCGGSRMWFANSSSISRGYSGSGGLLVMFMVDVIYDSPNHIIIVDKDEATLPRFLILYEG